MSTQPSEAPKPTRSLELPVEELLRRARPLPPHEKMIVEGLTDEEEEAFWQALETT
ncbi:MAG TPA: hypothetical protein VLL25_00210 [Acidimicrobiales bacterium]|nr:hypothetical protein [Acidimicrobiales bacterium]